MLRSVLLVCFAATSLGALLSPVKQADAKPTTMRRRGAISAATAAVLVGGQQQAAKADTAVRKFGQTEGGVKYFDIEEGSCALFNVACSPQEGQQERNKASSASDPARGPLCTNVRVMAI